MLEVIVLFAFVCTLLGALFGRGPTTTGTLVRCAVIVVLAIGCLSMFRVWVRFLPYLLLVLAVLAVMWKTGAIGGPRRPPPMRTIY